MSAIPLPRIQRRTAAERLAHLGIEPKFPKRLRLVRSLPAEERGALSAETYSKILVAHIRNATT